MARYITPLQENKIDKELEGIKRLIRALVILYYRDLKSYLKHPDLYRNNLPTGKQPPRQIIDFWENDARVFLSFLVGSYRAGVFLRKIEADVLMAKRTLCGDHRNNG